MVLKWIKHNKYKLIVLGISAYLVTDLVVHKGMVRVMIPKSFPVYTIDSALPGNNNRLINNGKEWAKGINTRALLDKLPKDVHGLECDIYFDRNKHFFDVHHDEGTSTGLNLDDLFQEYLKRELHASVWLDYKNLEEANAVESLSELNRLKEKYGLHQKILVESSRPELLRSFSDSGYFTSFYVPMFNPYLIGNDAIKQWVDTISHKVKNSSVNAISGYYFQYPFLHQYFPNYPILTWSPNDRFSLVNWLFKRKQATDKAVFIALYP